MDYISHSIAVVVKIYRVSADFKKWSGLACQINKFFERASFPPFYADLNLVWVRFPDSWGELCSSQWRLAAFAAE